MKSSSKASSKNSAKKPVSAAPIAVAPPPVSERKRILLVDDHPMMRAGLAQLINRQTDLSVTAEADDPLQAMAVLAKGEVDVVLTDITMPGRSGLEFIKDVRALYADLPILVVSMHDEMIYAERVLKAGARGYVMKEAGGEKLLAAIRQVLTGAVYVGPKVAAKIVDNFSGQKPRGSSSPIELLSDREFEVFQLIGEGKGTREIAEKLGVSPKTVDVHRGNIKEKLGLKDATALVRHAVRWIETQTPNP